MADFHTDVLQAQCHLRDAHRLDTALKEGLLIHSA